MSAETETFKIFITEDEAEKDLTREDIVELLYNDVAIVTFTKVDGSERVMKCTLLQEILSERMAANTTEDEAKNIEWMRPVLDESSNDPNKSVKEELAEFEEKVTAPNANVIAVYDIPSDGWRSFRLDSVKSISIPNPTPNNNKIPPYLDA